MTEIALVYEADRCIGLGHAVRAETLAGALGALGIPVWHVVSENTRRTLLQRQVAPDRILINGSAELASRVSRITHVIVDTLWKDNLPGTVETIHAWRLSDSIHVAIIDSMAPDHWISSKHHLPPHTLITPYLNAERLRDTPGCIRWLAGCDYALLGARYHDARHKAAVLPREPRLLISCGGSDPEDLSLQMAIHVAPLGTTTHVVVGPMFHTDHREQLQKLAERYPNLLLHHAPEDLSALILQSTLVAGRPGLLRYEAACLGRHACYLAHGNGYKAYYEAFSQSGVAEIVHDTGSGELQTYLQRLQQLLNQQPQFNLLAFKRIDAQGSTRLVQHLLAQ